MPNSLAAALEWVRSFNPYRTTQLQSEQGLQPIPIEESGIKKKAGIYFVVFFILFAIWAAWAPIDAGVYVSGSVVVVGSRKQVQHPTGGVIEAILVKEGDHVKQGDVLIKVNPLQSQANLSSAELDYFNAMAAESRLLSARTGSRKIVWLPEMLAKKDDPRTIEIMKTQERLFESQVNDHNGQIAMLGQQISGLKSQVASEEAVLVSRKQQLALMSEEAKSNEQLAAEGYIPRAKANEVLRAKVEIEAGISTLIGDMAHNRSTIAANQSQMLQVTAAYNKDIETQLAETQKTRKALKEKVDSLAFDMALTEIKAPASGTVVGLKVTTMGGVIPGGQVLMEILPENSRMIIEADVPTQQIDKVHVGLESFIRFSAFNVNRTPEVPGRVILVGADKLAAAPPTHPNDYYLVQIEPTSSGLKLLDGQVIQPGMPAEVVIKQGERSFLSYMFKPITDRTARAFKD